LRTIVGQNFQCESMGAAGRCRAVSRFAWERIALDAQNIYRQIQAQRRLSPSLQLAVVR